MSAINFIYDKRIKAMDFMVEFTIGEYYNLVKDCLNDNEYQRKRVRNSGSIYSLLKQDLIKGCIMPPIVLAYDGHINENDDVKAVLLNSCNKVKILDGLQRSYTIREIVNECEQGVLKDIICNPLDNPIRVEVYSGINKLGILYRMLTLNKGQTQMSARHQIEIIYSEYKKRCEVPGVTLLAEVDNRSPKNLGEYKFRDAVDGFTSYLQKDFLTLDRMDILDNVKNLERLATVDSEEDLFNDFLDSYHHFVYKFNSICAQSFDGTILQEELGLESTPFATSVIMMFNKSQPLTGFGNMVATLCDRKILNKITQLHELIELLKDNSAKDGFYDLIVYLDKVRGIAKKIGNDQRLYFYQFFKNLFDQNEDCFLDISEAAKKAFREYERIVL